MQAKYLLFILVIWSINGFAQSEAEGIFIKATEQLLSNNVKMSVNHKTSDNRGRTKEKGFDLMLAEIEGVEKLRMYMTQPERAKGVTIVMSKKAQEEGIIEVYTPANGKTRKMMANKKNMAMVGSDLSFAGYNSDDWQSLDIQLLAPTKVNEITCHTLLVRNKDKEGGSAQLSIDKQSNKILQVLTFNDENIQQSLSLISNYQAIEGTDDKIHPRNIHTTNLVRGEVSEILIESVLPLANPKPEDFIIEQSPTGQQ